MYSIPGLIDTFVACALMLDSHERAKTEIGDRIAAI